MRLPGRKREQEPDGGVVVLGGGLASQRCVETLRKRGYDGRIRIVSAEQELPYDRPPLSKELLAGKVDDGEVSFRSRDWYEDNDVELVFGARAQRLDPRRHAIELDDGTELGYEKLLIATGSESRRLPALEGYSNVHFLRTIADARRLRDEIRAGAKLAIVGGGFIGQEVASTARAAGAEVTIIEALPAPLSGILGEEVGTWFSELHADQGVQMRTGAMLSAANGNGAVEELVLESGERLECDAVVVGVGVAPAAGWLMGSGLEPDGVLTDDAGRTSVPDVFAAGDVTRSFDSRIGEHRRSEHWDAAARQGASAALAMLGLEPEPAPLPSFWSDQYGLRIQYVGHADVADDFQLEGDAGEREFTATYTRDGRTVAGLAVGRPRELARMRREIERTYSDNQGKEKQ